MLRRVLLSLCLILGSTGAVLAQKGDAGQAVPGGGAPSLQVQNATGNVVNNVYVSPSSSRNWGQDQLGSDEVIQPGASRSFDLPAGECSYDIRIVYQGGVAEERRRLDVCNGAAVVLPMAAQRLAR